MGTFSALNKLSNTVVTGQVETENTTSLASHFLFPNPSSGIYHLQGLGTEVERIDLFDAAGTLVSTSTANVSDGIDILSAPQGLYLARIYLKSQVLEQKLIKE
jgi:hypothetical protein